jgi:hypothetical protein
LSLNLLNPVCPVFQAIWFTETQGEEGSVFGSSSPWKGLGILLDSFDNDGQNNNPFISIMTNDGTMSYDHHTYVFICQSYTFSLFQNSTK